MKPNMLKNLPTELWKWDAVDLASAIRNGLVSSTEVVKSCLDRMDDVNPKLNAVVVTRHEQALKAAEVADAAVARGDTLGALHGVPVTTKINVDQAGEATSNGVVAFRDNIATEDSPVVANLKAAGAVIVGRNNSPAFGWSWFTQNDLYGRSMNPWSELHSPAGSSGGAAASVAAGITPIAQGNDMAGSIRYPAYSTGVAGLRPSFGRVPSFLPSAKHERQLSSQLFSVQGPLARRIRDIRLALNVMAKEDPRDPWWVPAPLEGPPRPRRVALSTDPAKAGVHPTVADAVQRAGKLLADAGYTVEAVDPPDFQAIATDWMNIVTAEEPYYVTPLIEQYGDARLRKAQAQHTMIAAAPDPRRYMEALARRTGWIRRWNIFMQDFPLLLCPVSFEPPPRHEHDPHDAESLSWIRRINTPSYTIAVLGLPAISVPTGLSGGLPTGVQIVAPQLREDMLLDAAEVVEAGCPMGTPIDPRF